MGGRRVGKTCVAPTRKNRHKRRCTRSILAATLTFPAQAGRVRVRFQGQISARRKLKIGGYALLATAAASGQRSAARSLRFTIAR